jgi:DNA-directed RNA polymerase subunit RPC12/RpoP
MLANITSMANCPCCGAVLYRLYELTKKGSSVWLVTDNSPRVEADKGGHFIECPNCSKRVEMIEDPRLPGFSYTISPHQAC